jgi:hypothetical protein
MLRGKETGQPGAEPLLEQNPRMHQIPVSGCLIGKKPQPLSIQTCRRTG